MVLGFRRSRKKPRNSKVKRFFFGETLMKSNIGDKEIVIKKKPFLLSLMFGHDVKVNNRAHSSFYIYDEGDSLRMILANHKGKDLHLIPSIAESLARKMNKSRVFVEVTDSEIEKYLRKNGFSLHGRPMPNPVEPDMKPVNPQLLTNVYVKDLKLNLKRRKKK